MIEYFLEWAEEQSVTLVTRPRPDVLQPHAKEINDVACVTTVTSKNRCDVESVPAVPRREIFVNESISPVSTGYTGHVGYNTEAEATSGVTQDTGDEVTRVTNAKTDLRAVPRDRETEGETAYTDAELFESMRRLEAAKISIAVWEDGSMRVIQSDTDVGQARADGGTIYTPQDMYHYIRLDERERRILHTLRFGGTIEWRMEVIKRE